MRWQVKFVKLLLGELLARWRDRHGSIVLTSTKEYTTLLWMLWCHLVTIPVAELRCYSFSWKLTLFFEWRINLWPKKNSCLFPAHSLVESFFVIRWLQGLIIFQSCTANKKRIKNIDLVLSYEVWQVFKNVNWCLDMGKIQIL